MTFDIDANGILNVSARDKATGKQQNITITASSGLSKDEIERMKREAEANAADDAKRQREEIEVENQARLAGVQRPRRRSASTGTRSTPTDKQAIETALTEMREALKTEDLERIKRAQEALTKASHKLAEVMYKDAQAKTQPGARAGLSPAPRADGGGAEGRRGGRRVRGSGREEVDAG